MKKRVRRAMSRRQAVIFESQQLGDEPSFKPGTIIMRLQYSKILSWYARMGTARLARTYLVDWLKSKRRKKDLALLRRVHDNWMPLTAAWICHLDAQGVLLPEEHLPFVEASIASALTHAIDVGETAEAPIVARKVKKRRARVAPADLVHELQRASHGINGPRRFIDRECFDGHSWEEVTSREGVVSEVTKIAERVLVE